jgi:hypothetical protein
VSDGYIPDWAKDRLGQAWVLDVGMIDNKSDEMVALRALDDEGWINLTRTDMLDAELENGTDDEKRQRLLGLSAPYVEHLGPMTFDKSRLDHAVSGDDTDSARLDAVLGIIGPNTPRDATSKTGQNTVADAMHIATAVRYGATGFVTNDTRLLKAAPQLAAAFNGFLVRNPAGALEIVRRLRSRAERRLAD